MSDGRSQPIGALRRRCAPHLALLAVAAGGCAPSPPARLANLPPHELNLAPPAPPPKDRRPPAQAEPVPAAWKPRAHRPWRHIVIHHSATDRGCAAVFDRWHRERNGWDSLGYHFVICNGRGGGDGEVEVGPRWAPQKWGAHCGGTPDNEYNNYGIGICLVGDFRERLPSDRQLASLRRLVRYLAGRYGIPPGRVIGHRDAPNARTACPGAALHRYIRGPLRSALRRGGPGG
jgi:hypothetical protein